jgi:hypothetical protein
MIGIWFFGLILVICCMTAIRRRQNYEIVTDKTPIGINILSTEQPAHNIHIKPNKNSPINFMQ